jgi:hypothetical protein
MLSFLRESLQQWDRNYFRGRLYLLKNVSNWRRYRRILQMSRRPVLVGGCGRSGTTLLLSLLSVHPNLYVIPEETGAFCMDLYTGGETTELRMDMLYNHLLATDASFEGRNRWCEKTPMNVHAVDPLLDYFGTEMRFLHIVRDGRDVVTSRHPKKPNTYWVSPERWIRDVQAGRDAERHLQVMTVQYEELVADHIPVMKSICAFIDEPFTDAFLDYPDTAELQENVAWFSEASDVHSDSVQRWKKPEHRDVVRQLLNHEQGRELLEYYDYL